MYCLSDMPLPAAAAAAGAVPRLSKQPSADCQAMRHSAMWSALPGCCVASTPGVLPVCCTLQHLLLCLVLLLCLAAAAAHRLSK
jgi:hypothetical protein